LDAELGKHLASYVVTHLALGSTLAEAKAEMDAAAKAARQKAKTTQASKTEPAVAKLLARLFRYGSLAYHGGFVGLSSLAVVQALRIDPNYWRRMRDRREYGAPFRTASRRKGLENHDR
jgi:hypothetical protein